MLTVLVYLWLNHSLNHFKVLRKVTWNGISIFACCFLETIIRIFLLLVDAPMNIYPANIWCNFFTFVKKFVLLCSWKFINIIIALGCRIKANCPHLRPMGRVSFVRSLSSELPWIDFTFYQNLWFAENISVLLAVNVPWEMYRVKSIVIVFERKIKVLNLILSHGIFFFFFVLLVKYIQLHTSKISKSEI